MEDWTDNDLGLAAIHMVNDGQLLGLDGLSAPQVVRQVKKMAQRNNALQDKGARAEMLARVDQLPDDIKKALLNKRLHIADKTFYSIKTLTAGNKTLKVFENQDTKTVGQRNIANAKLEKDMWFLLSAIVVLLDPTGAPSQYTAASALTRDFLDGEYTLKVGKKTLLDSESLQVFGSTQDNQPQGYYKLTNPKFIEPQLEIEMTIELATAFAANTDVKVLFIGAATLPY